VGRIAHKLGNPDASAFLQGMLVLSYSLAASWLDSHWQQKWRDIDI